MDKAVYILKNVYHLYHLAGRILSREGKFLAVPFDGFLDEDPVFNSPKLLQMLMDYGREQKTYKGWNDNGYWYYVFHDLGDYVIWGPVNTEEHSENDYLLYCKQHEAKAGYVCDIPLMKMGELEEIIMFVHGLLTDEYENVVKIDNGIDPGRFQESLHAGRVEYELENEECDKKHFPFAREDQMWKWIIGGGQGKFSFGTGKSFEDLVESAGVMAQSQKKNLEYGIVSGITLLTRYAIATGVGESAAYILSDVLLQKLAKAANVMEMRKVMEYALAEFGRLGKGAKSETHSIYVEQSREYVAKHIFKKLSLQEIAKEIGVHPAYLSGIFKKQTGMTLTDYIMQEKIQVSCNLLKYSNRSIAIIAEYMNLSPQSYFTRVFKKVTGETPAQYRRTHVVKNFLDN